MNLEEVRIREWIENANELEIVRGHDCGCIITKLQDISVFQSTIYARYSYSLKKNDKSIIRDKHHSIKIKCRNIRILAKK